MTTMKSAIEKILAAHGQLDAFQKHEHYSVKISNKGGERTEWRGSQSDAAGGVCFAAGFCDPSGCFR